MDIATLLGFLGAFITVTMAMIVGGDITIFINVPSLLIVIVGTIFVVMMRFGLGQFLASVKVALKAFFTKVDKIDKLIGRAVELANTARASGLLALENEPIENDFMKKGVSMLVDGQDIVAIRSMLTKEMDQTVERHQDGQSLFTSTGDVAPAMGMIGTLIGLVQMLSNMSDPASIGPAMAVALLTTLYGAMIANMIALPIADKLKLRSKEERVSKSLIIDAITSIHAGQNPRVIEDMLQNYLPGKKRKKDE